jgi:glycosyltransferase involved in cell wall biosynthesis
MKVLIATDAWVPQMNGVVATYKRLAEQLPALGCEVEFLTPADFHTVKMPHYREIGLAWPDSRRASNRLSEAAPDHIHIATEGPVGWMTRAYCLRRGLTFTTSYHTRFPEYAAHHFRCPAALVYAGLRRFHAPSAGIMVATASLRKELAARGFKNVMAWTRGVDTTLFRPRHERIFGNDEPVFLYVGRVSPEKNIEAFLKAGLPGLKVVVGDGPHLRKLAEQFPGVRFAGRRCGEDLARHYASADVFVFPSRTDTFGLVILEALASGVPVAAYPVTGPIDIVESGVSGVLHDDIEIAARRALTLDRAAARQRALQFTWRATAEAFLDNIREARSASLTRAQDSSRQDSRPLPCESCGSAAIRRL